jgi:hypothetical protein
MVTNVILSTPLYFDEEKEVITKKINEFFDDTQKGFVNMDDENLPDGWYGGAKMLEAELFIGAFNYLDLPALIEHLKNIDWDGDIEEVQLIVKEQEDDRFRIINIS